MFEAEKNGPTGLLVAEVDACIPSRLAVCRDLVRQARQPPEQHQFPTPDLMLHFPVMLVGEADQHQ